MSSSPLINHYRCNVYYIPEKRAYSVSGSTELFPQHCQLPNLSPHQHLRKLTDELAAEGTIAGATTKSRRLLKLLQAHIGNILTPKPPPPPVHLEPTLEQRVQAEQQRVIDESPIITIPRITDAPGIMTSCNPTTKRNIKAKLLVHRRVTRNNTPGGVLLIARCKLPTIVEDGDVTPAIATRTRSRIPLARSHLILQHALNMVIITEAFIDNTESTPRILTPRDQQEASHATSHVSIEHYANPMVNLVTGKTILSYKKLMHDPATAEVWQTAFGKDFGSMSQGVNKTGQTGMDAMFIMTHDKIAQAYRDKNYLLLQIP